jgi:LacI family transcriptional regulator, galactose operon repressor
MTNRRANIREIAREAGVSVATVSRALNRKPGSTPVSEKLRKRILDICERLQYQPNINTKRMLSGRADTIAFIATPETMHTDNQPGMLDNNLARAIGGIEKYLAHHGKFPLIAVSTPEFLAERMYLNFFRSRMVDGMIIWGWTRNEKKHLNALIKEKVPIVTIQGIEAEQDAASVNLDEIGGMRMIVEHLYQLGHRSFAWMPPTRLPLAGVEREKGLLAAMNEFGIEPVAVSNAAGFDFDSGFKAGMELLSGKINFTCIVCPNDWTALGVIEAANKLNIKIPEEVSLTGADGLHFPGIPPLTTYSSSGLEIGEAAGRLLLEQITAGRSIVKHVRLPVKLTVGSTTAPV